MSVENVARLIVAAALVIYLVLRLLFPAKF
ncbi:K(+)-transporting ATPase subunit F [Streptomyces sp. x-19]